MKQPQPSQKAAQLDLAIKPLRVVACQGNSGDETARKPRVVVATFY